MIDQNLKTSAAYDFADFEDGSYSYSRLGRGRKHAQPDDPLRDVLETLYSEHRYISSLLDTLKQHAARLKPGKIPDYHLLLDIIDYLRHYPDQYHHPREDLLFTLMLESNGKLTNKLQRLEREHETLHYFTHELFNELTRIADGRPVDRPELSRRVERYIDGYRGHMHYENTHVFPLVKGALNTADLERLRERTRYIDDPLFGDEVQYRYRRLGRNLQARVEVAGQQFIAGEMSAIESLVERLSGFAATLEQLKSSADRRGRENWREQLDTVKAHTRLDGGPGIVFLPGALLKNHLRQLGEGIGEMREILRGENDRANRH